MTGTGVNNEHTCSEDYASAAGMTSIYRKLAPEKNSGLTQKSNPSIINCKDIFNAANRGNETAKEALCRFGQYLGRGTAMIATVLNPACIAFGGGVSNAGEKLLEMMLPAFREYVFKPCADVAFKIASLGNDAGIYGAVKPVLDRMLQKT